jgi:hypothetical protein
MRWLDTRLIKWGVKQPVSPPVFIIGAPRTGTTLLYQLLTQRYELAYFTNLTTPFYKTPVVAFWVSHHLLFEPKVDDYTSNFGKTKGWHSPHECGDFWYRWFPRGERVYVPPEATPKKVLNTLSRTVRAMSAVSDTLVIFKNVYNSMRIAPLVESFPNATFLVSRRDPVDTAQSILKSRIKALGRKDAWWSLPPKEIFDIKKHPYWQQVVEQVYYTYQQIAEDRRRFQGGKFFDVKYEEVCQDTYGTLAKIEHFLEKSDIHLRAHRKVPTHFSLSTGRKVADEDYCRIREEVAKLWGE